MTHLEKYMSIIQNRLVNPLPEDVYGEIHHIVPRSICPILAKAPSNLVRLSAEEHFLAHYYIWRAYSDLHEQSWARKMCWAFRQMKRVITKCEDVEQMSLLYAEMRKDFAENNPMKNPEAKKKISEAMKGENNPMRLYPDKNPMKGENNPMKNPEVRAKLFKKVIQITLDGKLVSEFSSLQQAAMKTGCNEKSISSCCHGKQKTSGGYLWRFSEDVHTDK